MKGFFNTEEGGFYPYEADGEQLLTRKRDPYDGAMPSGNSVAALVLLRLSRLTGEKKWETAARKQLAYLAGFAQTYPVGQTFGLLAVDESLRQVSELICCANDLPAELTTLLQKADQPELSVLLKTPENAIALASIAPYTEAYPIPEEGAAYYLCTNRTCSRPVYSVEELKI